jgi:hypothetical protein
MVRRNKMAGEFTQFVNEKLLKEETKQVSANLTKNIIDILREYVVSEYDISDDEKSQILNNLKISIEEHDRGVGGKGPKFTASSFYSEGEGIKVPVELSIEIVTESMGKGADTEEPSVEPKEEKGEKAEEEPMEAPE